MPTALPASAALALPQDAPFTARRVLRLLQRLRVGVLTVILPDGSQHRFGLIHKVEDIGRVFVWIRPIEAGQRLYCLNAA